MKVPKFKHIAQFSYIANGGSPTQIYEFLQQNKGPLRIIHLHNLTWSYPAECISIRNLTHFDFLGIFPAESQGIADILSNGTQIESLRLQCVLECNASAQFREHLTSLPFLRHFAFSLVGYRVNDYDLFPAISEFLRDRSQLHTLHLTVPSADWAQRRLGRNLSYGYSPSFEGDRNFWEGFDAHLAARGVRRISATDAFDSSKKRSSAP